ncbi:hypothetical protein [Burkholderia multivorans]|uniref:hypothetical protein n=1 Tax=Burkholderia multivorans TaxID=87883 RepID=UPI0020B2F110|nr:hypothetical protein [Burkholderia multivorans]
MNDQQQSRADALTDEQLATLKQTALAATPQNIDSAESIDHYTDGRYIECPCCSGEGTVELEADFLNYDGKALGVQFYGIGNEPGAAEAYFRAASPATILALLARLEHAEAALATSANETGAEGATEQFIVIGHGESDIPEAKIVARRADVLDAVLSMIYGGPCPDDAMRAEYASMLGDWDGDHWNVTFEIGGIDVWRVGLSRSPAMAAAAPADERAAQGLLTIGRCMGIKAAVRYIDSAGLTTAIDHAAEIRKLADPERPRDCSRDPSSCPDNEGYGCWCSDQARAAASPAAEALTDDAHRKALKNAIDWCHAMAFEDDERALRELLAAPQPAQADAPAEAREPAAWVTPEGDRALTQMQKQGMLRDGGASASSVRPYSIPCYAGSATVETREARLTDEQREAIEYAITWMDQNVSNRYAYTAAKELRALLNGADHEQ